MWPWRGGGGIGFFLPFCGAEETFWGSGWGSDGEEERKEREETKTGVAGGAKWNSTFELEVFKEQLRVEV